MGIWRMSWHCHVSWGRLRRRFPAEAESAALGAALQAAAVLQGVPVRQYVSDNPPPCEPEVRAREAVP